MAKSGNKPPPVAPPSQEFSAGASTVFATLSKRMDETHAASDKEQPFWLKVAREVPMIRKAPYSFGLTTLSATFVLAILLHYFGILTPYFVVMYKDSQIETLTQEVTNYKRIFEGASPSEVKKQLSDLQSKVSDFEAAQWLPLSSEQKAKIIEALKDYPPRNIQIMFLDKDARPLVQSFEEIFKKLKWPQPYEPDIALGWTKEGIWLGPIDDTNEKIKSEIESITGLSTTLFPSRLLINQKPELTITIGYKPKSVPQ